MHLGGRPHRDLHRGTVLGDHDDAAPSDFVDGAFLTHGLRTLLPRHPLSAHSAATHSAAHSAAAKTTTAAAAAAHPSSLTVNRRRQQQHKRRDQETAMRHCSPPPVIGSDKKPSLCLALDTRCSLYLP